MFTETDVEATDDTRDARNIWENQRTKRSKIFPKIYSYFLERSR